ncbi:MAG TPA: hypothetical protein VKV04_25545, partial [Verrucomicrobiae bacterium]|nr:hypothetical protein [Verrucomicrobiae bacterium]
KPVGLELIPRIDNYQVIRLKPTPDIVDTDRDESLRRFQIIERWTATANEDCFAGVAISK